LLEVERRRRRRRRRRTGHVWMMWVVHEWFLLFGCQSQTRDGVTIGVYTH